MNYLWEKVQFVAELAGMPKAGKTTHMENIDNILKHEKGERVGILQRGARTCHLPKEDRYAFHCWSVNDTLKGIIEAKQWDVDWLLIDRGVYDNIAFTEALFKEGYIPYKRDKNNFIKYLRMYKPLQDAVFYFRLDPEISLAKELAKVPYEGNVMNKKFLENLYNSYEEVYKEMQNDLERGIIKNLITVEGEDNYEENKIKLISEIFEKSHPSEPSEFAIPK